MELSDWSLKEAIRSAKDDGEWEREMDHFSLRSGEIRITPKLNKGIPVGFDTKGAGIQPGAVVGRKLQATEVSSSESKSSKSYKPPTPTSYKAVPAIATKTVQAQDVYMAIPQHNNFGVEMQPLMSASVAKNETLTM